MLFQTHYNVPIDSSNILAMQNPIEQASTSRPKNDDGINVNPPTRNDALSRLVEKQIEDIEAITEKIKLWTNFRDDYKSLKNLVNVMQDKVRHPYRVPIAGSKLAFVKGHIIHTNELTVLLGFNYFALRSARQAAQIIDRRLRDVELKLKDSEMAKARTEDWLLKANEYKCDKEKYVEIIETA